VCRIRTQRRIRRTQKKRKEKIGRGISARRVATGKTSPHSTGSAYGMRKMQAIIKTLNSDDIML
jgi:hypothetical protein